MINQQHPITPPPELVQQWAHMLEQHSDAEVFTQAAHWGADQELEACVEHLKRIWSPSDTIDSLYTARRPKPPSLKAQALEAQQRMWDGKSTHADWELVRRALEQLDD